MPPIKITHIAVVVEDVQAALGFWHEALGLPLQHIEHNEGEAVDIAFLPLGDGEIELIAQVARYHRKSQPSEDKHAEFAALHDDDRARVRSMAALLRVAIGLDRNHDGAVDGVVVEDRGDAVVMRLVPVEPEADLTLEQYSADHRSSLLSQQLGCEVVVAS